MRLKIRENLRTASLDQKDTSSYVILLQLFCLSIRIFDLSNQISAAQRKL